MMIIKNIFDNVPLLELQELLQLKREQQATLMKFLNKVKPREIVLELYETDHVETLTFNENKIIPPEFRNLFASLADRLAGEIMILTEVIEEKTLLN